MTKWPQPALKNLRSILVDLYPLKTDGMRLAEDAGLAAQLIAFSDQAITNWFEILKQANNQDKVDALKAVAEEEHPGNEDLLAAKAFAPQVKEEPEPVPGKTELVPVPEAGTSSLSRLEKILGNRSTLVSISYLELGLLCAKSVGRIIREDGNLATGFMTAGGVLVTNNHVLPDAATAASSVVQFNYQRTTAGLDAPLEEFDLTPDAFFRTSKEDDWSAVRVKGDASKWGELEMKAREVKVGDHVNIIQHPGGTHKQISFVANVVAFVGGGRIQYLTDTLPGSSGSPVFNTDWNLIGLHHSGGWLTEPNAASKTTYYRNEGIAIDRVVEGLAAKP